MLNSIGLQGPGIDGLVADVLPRLAALGLTVWVSVGGFSARDYASICELLDERGDVATIELNLSCPNVDEAPESSAQIVAACRAATAKPLYAKLSPATWDIAESARAVVAAGADGLSLVNTIRGMALDPAHAAPPPGPRRRRLLRPGLEAGRARLRPRVRLGRGRADRRDGRRGLGDGRARARRRGSIRCRAWHHPLRRSGRTRPHPGRARGRVHGPRASQRTGSTGNCHWARERNPCKSSVTVLLDCRCGIARLDRSW